MLISHTCTHTQLMMYENTILRVKEKGHYCYLNIYSFNRYLLFKALENAKTRRDRVSSVKDFIPRGFQQVAPPDFSQ